MSVRNSNLTKPVLEVVAEDEPIKSFDTVPQEGNFSRPYPSHPEEKTPGKTSIAMLHKQLSPQLKHSPLMPA
jgi:hypothetical protein